MMPGGAGNSSQEPGHLASLSGLRRRQPADPPPVGGDQLRHRRLLPGRRRPVPGRRPGRRRLIPGERNPCESPPHGDNPLAFAHRSLQNPGACPSTEALHLDERPGRRSASATLRNASMTPKVTTSYTGFSPPWGFRPGFPISPASDRLTPEPDRVPSLLPDWRDFLGTPGCGGSPPLPKTPGVRQPGGRGQGGRRRDVEASTADQFRTTSLASLDSPTETGPARPPRASPSLVLQVSRLSEVSGVGPPSLANNPCVHWRQATSIAPTHTGCRNPAILPDRRTRSGEFFDDRPGLCKDPRPGPRIRGHRA